MHTDWLFNIRNGDKVLIGKLYQNLLPKISDWFIKNQSNQDAALELFHESLSDLILSDRNPEIDNPDAYIFQMCKFKFYKLAKDCKRIVEPTNNLQLEHVDNESFELYEDEKLKFYMMDKHFSALSELCQKLLNLLKDGKKSEEIATLLEMPSANTVNRRKFACMSTWAEWIKKDKMYHLLNQD